MFHTQDKVAAKNMKQPSACQKTCFVEDQAFCHSLIASILLIFMFRLRKPNEPYLRATYFLILFDRIKIGGVARMSGKSKIKWIHSTICHRKFINTK